MAEAFSWRWAGTIPAKDQVALRAFGERAHAQGRQVRFWNTPDRREVWPVLKEAGVDLTDLPLFRIIKLDDYE